jgi:hypothetical protein
MIRYPFACLAVCKYSADYYCEACRPSNGIVLEIAHYSSFTSLRHSIIYQETQALWYFFSGPLKLFLCASEAWSTVYRSTLGS